LFIAQIYCCKANRTADITLHTVRNFVPSFSLKYSQCRNLWNKRRGY